MGFNDVLYRIENAFILAALCFLLVVGIDDCYRQHVKWNTAPTYRYQLTPATMKKIYSFRIERTGNTTTKYALNRSNAFLGSCAREEALEQHTDISHYVERVKELNPTSVKRKTIRSPAHFLPDFEFSIKGKDLVLPDINRDGHVGPEKEWLL